MFFKRMALVDFLKAMVAASHEPHAEEVRNTILPKLTTVECFVEHFAIHKSSAAAGAGTFEDPVVLDEDENLVSDQGLATATADVFEEFKKNMSPLANVSRICFPRCIVACLMPSSWRYRTQRSTAPRSHLRLPISLRAQRVIQCKG